jgi:hypothetical protein
MSLIDFSPEFLYEVAARHNHPSDTTPEFVAAPDEGRSGRISCFVEDAFERMGEEAFADYANSLPHPMILVGRDRRVEFINMAWAQQSPVTPDVWLGGRIGGASVHSHFIGEDREMLRNETCPMCVCFDTRASRIGRVGFRISDWATDWFILSCRPRRGGGVVIITTAKETERTCSIQDSCQDGACQHPECPKNRTEATRNTPE